MDIYEGKCTCGDDDCTRTLVIEPAFRVSIVDETDELAVAEIMTRDQLLDWVGSDEAGVIQNARNELSIEPDAGAVWQWLDGNETADLRRQLAEAQAEIAAWVAMRDAANAAIAEAAELRRQLEATQAEIAALRIENAAIAAIAAICPTCGGSGAVDSGGFTPWGVGIDATCPTCNGRGKAYTDADDTPHGAEKGDA